MDERMIGYQRDGPFNDLLGLLPLFNDQELKIVELSSNGHNDKDIAKALNINLENLHEIRARIRQKALRIIQYE